MTEEKMLQIINEQSQEIDFYKNQKKVDFNQLSIIVLVANTIAVIWGILWLSSSGATYPEQLAIKLVECTVGGSAGSVVAMQINRTAEKIFSKDTTVFNIKDVNKIKEDNTE